MISLVKTLLTVDATRRRAIGQILLLAAGFLVLVAISTTSVVLVNRAREDNGWVVHTVEVENQMNALLLEVRRAESGARGFLLTSEPRFRTEYEAAVAAVIANTDKLKELSRDNPVQVENIKRLRAPLDARLDEFAPILIPLKPRIKCGLWFFNNGDFRKTRQLCRTLRKISRRRIKRRRHCNQHRLLRQLGVRMRVVPSGANVQQILPRRFQCRNLSHAFRRS